MNIKIKLMTKIEFFENLCKFRNATYPIQDLYLLKDDWIVAMEDEWLCHFGYDYEEYGDWKNLGEDISNLDFNGLKKVCKKNAFNYESEETYSQLLDRLMSEHVEPKLIQPTFVIDYPTIISPLAKKHRNGNPNIVERFELFIGGAEFANAFTELNDPLDQRERFESQQKLAVDGDDEAHPVDENFLQAIECGMPPTGGVGIGIDRLVMLLTENRSIKDVILFPAMKNE